MSLLPTGWVELKTDRWRAVIKVENLVMNVDSSGLNHFFGSIPQGRKLPDDAARETKYDLDQYDGDPFARWTTWGEMKISGWEPLNFAEDWLVLIEMMRSLAKVYGDNNVRLVATQR
jgi:hypothetical protein